MLLSVQVFPALGHSVANAEKHPQFDPDNDKYVIMILCRPPSIGQEHVLLTCSDQQTGTSKSRITVHLCLVQMTLSSKERAWLSMHYPEALIRHIMSNGTF